MNTVTGFVAIVSLLLAMALAGGAAKDQAKSDVPPRDITPSKIVLNHSETMVNDAALVEQADFWGWWWTSLQVSIFNRFTNFTPGDDGCPDWGCGANHNETMVSDAALVQHTGGLSQWLTSVQVFIFKRFTNFAPDDISGDDCESWGCGSNHNETMLSDVTSIQQTESWSQFLSNVQVFIFNRFSISVPGGGGCDEWGCGGNHDETIVRDEAR